MIILHNIILQVIKVTNVLMNYFGSKPLKKYMKFFHNNPVAQNNIALGWGRKASFNKANVYAEKYKLPCICLEDGFIRSLGLGKEGVEALSIVVDHLGIYFDSTKASDLEKLILNEENKFQNKRAKNAIQIILSNKITKYNQSFSKLNQDFIESVTRTKNILLVDQTFGDQSIKYTGAHCETFKKMLKQAHQDFPEAIIWIKTHPDVFAGKAKGHFDQNDFNLPYVQVLTENYNPLDLLQYFNDVYVVSSQMGFEALLLGKTVHCFGVPWYAGWGLTDDSCAPVTLIQTRRTVHRSLEHLFACAYLQYARYVSPVTGNACELEDILKLLIPNIQFQHNLPSKIVIYGFSPWKRKFISDYLSFPNTQLKFKKYRKPQKADIVLAWGKNAHQLKQQGYPKVITVEDGFIRSVGLGASLIRPCSLVFDDIGIYYDATRSSRIELLLNRIQTLDANQNARVDRILNDIKRLEISKYNVGSHQVLKRPTNKQPVILVVGQVEDDMSIQLGGMDIKTNLQLLQQVRSDHPHAYIIYKPHPDVEAGLRIGKIAEDIGLLYADQIETNTSIQRLFAIVDQIHTISSLSGFEALIRGLKVYCYGLPFYAGWGLTIDRHQCERRKNKVDLKCLVYITLIEYPTYNLAHTSKMDLPLVNLEDVMDYIDTQKSSIKTHPKMFRNVFAKILRSVSFWKK